MVDQPRVNVEIKILPTPERTEKLLRYVCATLREMVGTATRTQVAVRACATRLLTSR